MAAPSVDAIVVGAGPAGLACATELQRAGVGVIVLEASDRVGGRAHTNFEIAGGVPVEQGALMIHGRHVVTHRWVRELGLRAYRFRTTQRAVFRVGDRFASTPYLVLPFHPTFGTRAYLDATRRLPRARREYSGPDLSWGEFMDRARPGPAARLLSDLLSCHTYATDADRLGVIGPAEEVGRERERFGFHNYRVAEGYSTLMERRAAQLGDRLRRSSPVRTIDWSSPEVRVGVEAGPDAPSEFRTRAVVVTVPLSVLKVGAIAFTPELPETKQRAVRAISFGDAMTVHLRFRREDLPRTLRTTVLLWAGTASTFLRSLPRVDGGDVVLSAFTTGREAVRRTDLADPELIASTLDELRSVAPEGPSVGAPRRTAIRRWIRDPYALGAYSFLGVGCRLEERTRLAEPLERRLFFAGEAAHDGGDSATVHGAIETGYRAAREVIAARPRAS
ncbi:MAG TPA: NAD(P)/FAD-dependent oxidoreductase [Thermoplasmata archaeon]|nr:NAD(P)/FAD-dependent oxidoreductase [Thermoplasmata archaeon]